jgi:hypothetical protein
LLAGPGDANAQLGPAGNPISDTIPAVNAPMTPNTIKNSRAVPVVPWPSVLVSVVGTGCEPRQ